MAALAAGLFLSGCLQDVPGIGSSGPGSSEPGSTGPGSTGPGDAERVDRAADGLPSDAPPALDSAMQDGSRSAVIEALLNRRSVLAPGPMRDVAEAVMAANTRAAEADLRAARLRAEAEALNWLPQLGPQISLSSMGALVASMVVNQALFDNGQRRAERDYAAADVEVTAVALAQDSNARVREALDLYLTAEAARARAEVTGTAMERMEHFAWMMRERVNAGVSDRSDLQVVTQKLDQMRSDRAGDLETAASALAELQAMAAAPLDTLHGVSDVAAPQPAIAALSVMKAEAEGTRAVASATAQRAGFLPGLTLGGTVGSDGSSGGLTVAPPDGFGFGTRAAMEAVAAEAAAAEARVGQEREAAERRRAALEGRLVSLRRQAQEAGQLARTAAGNYELFAEQQRAGQRSVPEVVGVFETKIRAERAASDLAYEIARTEVEIAAHMGVLVDGERM